MLYSITVPGRDYSAIKNYLKKGYPDEHAMELLGRVYKVEENGYMITAKVMSDRAAILYTVQHGDKISQKTEISHVCSFHDMNIVISFDIDRTYDG